MAALATGVELNELDNGALYVAALRGDIAAIQAWLEAGGDVNADVFYQYDFAFPTRLLNLAVRNSHAKLVSILIGNGADINFVESWPRGMSALHRAIKPMEPALQHCDPTETAKLLIEAGADLFNKDLSEGNPYGDVEHCTELLFSATWHPDILRALLRAGIRVDGCVRDGRDVEAVLQGYIADYTEYSIDGEEYIPVWQESARILEGVRRAGSYRRYFFLENPSFFNQHHGMLALRKLVLCGRAKASLPTSLAIRKLVMSGDLSGRAKASLSTNLFFARLFSGTTVEVVKQIKVSLLVARLFAGTTAEPDGAAAPSLLPDPLFFLILQYWLGAY